MAPTAAVIPAALVLLYAAGALLLATAVVLAWRQALPLAGLVVIVVLVVAGLGVLAYRGGRR